MIATTKAWLERMRLQSDRGGCGRSLPPGHLYEVFGLLIESELEIPELPIAEPGIVRRGDVSIRMGDVPVPREPTKYIHMDIQFGAGWILIDPGEGARLLVRDGNAIIVAPYSSASASEMRTYVLGSAMGALLHQRGLLPLHGNAIVMRGGAVAICGASGAGKSTLAAEFQNRGYGLICDDLCLVSFDSLGRPVAWPGIPRLKLWNDSLSSLGMSSEGLSSIGWDLEKYHVPASNYAGTRSYPLRALYNLRDSGDVAPGIVRLSGLDAVNVVTANTYRRRFRELMGDAHAYLRQIGLIVQNVPAFDFIREVGFDRFRSETDRLEQHILDVARTACE